MSLLHMWSSTSQLLEKSGKLVQKETVAFLSSYSCFNLWNGCAHHKIWNCSCHKSIFIVQIISEVWNTSHQMAYPLRIYDCVPDMCAGVCVCVCVVDVYLLLWSCDHVFGLASFLFNCPFFPFLNSSQYLILLLYFGSMYYFKCYNV